MSALLIEWLNRDFHLDRPVASVEKDLSNGYLLGQVLHALEMDPSFPSGYVDSDTVPAMVGNMEQLSLALRSNDIPFTVDVARGIMMEKKGAATKVLMDLKMRVDKRQTKPKHVVPSTVSVRPPADRRRHFPSIDPQDTSARFVENLIKSLDPADVQNHNRIDMAIHLRKFSEFMWNTEHANAAHFASQSQASAAASAERRHEEQSHTHDKQMFLQQWTDDGEKALALNQSVQSTREATELQFELSLREKQRLLVVQQNDRAATDLHDGVVGFDKNFKRLGISSGDEDTNVRLTPIRGTGLEHLVTLEKQVDACHFRPASNVQMMKELRERRKVHLNAQKERASRRRKMLVDQTRNTIEIHRKQEEALLLKRLLHVGKTRRETLAELWQETYAHAQDKEGRATQLAARVNKASLRIEAAVKESLDVLHVVATATPRLRDQEAKAHVAKEATAAVALKRREVHNQTCREVVHVLIDMVWVMIAHRSTHAKAPIAPQAYRALKQAFVQGTVVPKPQKNANTAAGHSRTELTMLLSSYIRGTGPFDSPELGPLDSTPSQDVDLVVATLRELNFKPKEEIVATKWKPLVRPLLLCWYTKDPNYGVAATLAGDTGLLIVTIDSCVERSVKLGERVKGGEKLSAPETELATLGNKIAALRAKNSTVPDAVVSDVVNKAMVLLFVSPPDVFVGCILLNFPRSKEEAKTFEVEMVRRMTHLNDADAAARVGQLNAVLDDKNPLSDEDVQARPLPASSIDWVVFVDPSDEAAQLASVDESSKEGLQAKISAWKAVQATLTAFWRPFGCVYSVDPSTSTAFATSETLHLLLELVATPDMQLSVHATHARDDERFVQTLGEAKQARRLSLPLPEFLYTQELAGERSPLPQELFPTLYNTLAVQGLDAIQSKRQALFTDLYDCLLQLSEQFRELRASFFNVLCSHAQQRHIDATAQKLQALGSANPRTQKDQTKKLMSTLEVTLGDMVDVSRKAANEFLLSRRPLVSPGAMIAKVEGWLEQLVTAEISAFDARVAALDVYFFQVESIPKYDQPEASSIPTQVQPLMDALSRASSTSRFGTLIAPLIALFLPCAQSRPDESSNDAVPPEASSSPRLETPPSPTESPVALDQEVATASPPLDLSEDTASARRRRIVWNERGLLVRRVLAAIEFASHLIQRMEAVDAKERQDLDNITVEYMRQDHGFIQQVLKDLAQLPQSPTKERTSKMVPWPRVQGLTTPWICHNVDISAHRCFLHPGHVLILAKALATAPEQAYGLVELPHFSRIVRESALLHNEQRAASNVPPFPDIWTNFSRISHAALTFCAIPSKVEWRRFLQSVLVSQRVPLPRSKHLHALLARGTHQMPSSTIADAYWTKAAFSALPLWFDEVTDRPTEVKDCLYHMFADHEAEGHVNVATFLLHWCVSTYPTDVATALHESLAPFSRGLARAFRLLQSTPTSLPPSWDASKFRFLLVASHVPEEAIASVVAGYDYSAAAVESFVRYCEVNLPSLGRHWTFHNVYDHLLE